MGRAYNVRLVGPEGAPPPFTPREYQAEFMEAVQSHSPETPARAVGVWARRAGKDLTDLHNTLSMAHDRVAMYWHCLPVYEQARKACWLAFLNDGTARRLMDNVFPREIRRSPEAWSPRAEMLVELKNGSIVQFVGSDSIDRLVGSGPYGINFSEFALAKPSAWNLVRPILRQNGGWATFIFTPRGKNHGWHIFQTAKRRPHKGWFLSYKDIYGLGIYSRQKCDQILAEERAEGMPEELVRQEYLVDFSAANVGSYYGDLLEQVELRGGMEPFAHGFDDIIAVWDLGISDSTAIWLFRVTLAGVEFIAHYENNSQPLSHYFEWLYETAPGLVGSPNGKLGYRAFYFPHDARARTLQTGVSTMELAAKEVNARDPQPAGKVRLVPRLEIGDGIRAARWLLQQDVKFHPRCNEGVEALKAYHRDWDEDSRSFSRMPAHDWSSHTADAFRYGALVVKQNKLVRARTHRIVLPVPAGMAAARPTLDQMFADEMRARRARMGGGRRV